MGSRTSTIDEQKEERKRIIKMIYQLQFKAVLNNIEKLQLIDTSDKPFDFTFQISCVKCHERNSNNITINRFDHVELTNSRGEANFMYKCDFCKSESNANIIYPKKDKKDEAIKAYTYETSDEFQTIIKIEARGLVIEKFVAHENDNFVAKSEESSQVFKTEDGALDLTDDWYDVDESSYNEVSITEIEWTILPGNK